jgi:hypothetical protein
MSDRRTTRLSPSIAIALVGRLVRLRQRDTRVTSAWSTLPPRLAETCTAGSFGYRFGSE